MALIDYETIGNTDEEERDFVELAEYARVAAILIHETYVKNTESATH